MNYFKISTFVFAAFTFVTCSEKNLAPSVKQGTEVFEKWVKVQHVLEDRSLADMVLLLNDNYLKQFRTFYENNFMLLKPLTGFLQPLTAGQINQHGYQFQETMPMIMKENLSGVYDCLENNTKDFIELLKQQTFSAPDINKMEMSVHFDATVDKYKALTRLLFKQEGSFNEDEYLLAMANRLLEYCFQDQTFGHYQALINNQAYYPVARFLHSTLWYYLVGDGWKHWHKNTLNALKQSSDNGNRIIYPAGGADLYMLLQHGIYNITVVDPFLPSQQRYYSEGWDWLVNGEVGDEIQFCPPYRHITLKRTAFTPGDSFYAKLSTGNVAMLKKSMTTWMVFDGRTQEVLGSIVIDRRFTDQQDFKPDTNKIIVMSYDELIYAISPDTLDGWGINPDLLEDTQHIFVKQLRQPMTKSMLQNMRVATIMNMANLKFINFASDPS